MLACAPEPPGGPNFVLCMTDDQGWGDTGYGGHPVLSTPTLDAMASEGLRFDRFYSASPICSPARGALLTGRHPNRFGCFSWGHTLRPTELTVAEALRQAGYATGHFGKWHLGSVHPDSPDNPGAYGFETWVSSPNQFENDPPLSWNGKIERHQGEGSAAVVDAALEFIRAEHRERPFLAVVWFSAPHSPYRAVEEDLLRYAEEPEKLRTFYGELTAMDRALGRLRGELRALGIAEDTLLWFTSDNGPNPSGPSGWIDGGLTGGKGGLDEGGIRVPGLLEWPGRVAPRLIDEPCCSVDIAPTVLALAGVELPPRAGPLDGVSLVPLIEGAAFERASGLGFWLYRAPGRPVFSKRQMRDQLQGKPYVPEAVPPREPIVRAGQVAWIEGRYKLRGDLSSKGGETYRLIDLEQDPRELVDVLAEQPERAARMKADLDAWQQSVILDHNANLESAAPASAAH